MTPPDRSRCQARIPGNGPFTMGGFIGDPRDGYRVRCSQKPTVIVTERQPGADGFCGSMSLCDRCWAELLKQSGDAYVTFKAIRARRKGA